MRHDQESRKVEEWLKEMAEKKRVEKEKLREKIKQKKEARRRR